MARKIKILLVLFLYMLNFAHGIQPYEHSSDCCDETVIASNLCHIHEADDHQHDTHHNDIEDVYHNIDSHDQLPYHHHHSIQTHDYVILRTNQTVEKNSFNVDYIEQIFKLNDFDPNPIEKFIFYDIYSFQSFIKQSYGLRAPPMYS